MDSPALRLLLRPESQRWLDYLGWMLQNSGLSLTETPTGLVQEPKPESTKAEETEHADQFTVKPGANMNLIDLWSADPVPTQVPTLKPLSLPVPYGLLEAPVPSGDLPPPMSLSDFLVPSPPLVSVSPLDSSAPLVSSSSSALPPPLALCGSSASPQCSSPPARYGSESPASLRPSRPMSPPRPVSPPTPLWLCIPSAPPRLVCPRTPLGSLVHPDKPRSVVAQLPPRTSGSPAAPRPSTPSASPGSSLPLVSLSSSLAPSSPWSAESPALPQSREPAAPPWASRPSMSWSIGLSAPVPPRTLVPPQWIGFWVPTVGSTMVLVSSEFSRFQSFTSTTPSA
ncbi:wiskott-Aldrich syndrome protein homolog 1-like [Sinocyclocheilus grahami]|uniref:wiskott-Aldrich syndrome protein homolog 1-like n=1 Tax=Sinocyclocheilus grahami TaxID=75366 RepID=UPI0007AC70E7|nr:PREDICTED: wiskott-Aldrich syndrome protein homolog 1-like [Sinocyclocheilus grahami]